MTSRIFILLLALLAPLALAGDREGHYDAVEFLDGTDKISMQAPSGSDTWTFLLPPDDGLSGQVLTTNGTGVTTWTTKASAGANSDITSLTGLTTPLSVSQGGTGQTTATAAFNALDPLTTKGDLIVRDTTDSIRLAVGTNGHVLTADSAQASGVKWASSGVIDPYAVWSDFDEFFAVGTNTGQVGKLGWFSDAAGTAATVIRGSGIAGHPGLITLRPGNVATGRAAIALGGDGTNTMILSDGSTEVTWVLRSAQTLSLFEMLVVGLGDTANAQGDQVNGAYFQLLGAPTPDTNFFCVTSSASTRTRVNTGVAYVANTWFKLRITINAAGTSVQCNIDGVDAGTAITTNIPSVAVSPIAKVDGIAGGTASDTDIDLFRIVKTLTTPR